MFKPKTLNAIDCIKDKKKLPEIDPIYDYLERTETSNADKNLIKHFLNELVTEKVLINKKAVLVHLFR